MNLSKGISSKWIDVVLVLFCVGYLILMGRSFGVLLCSSISLLILIIRRINFKKHNILRRILTICMVIGGLSFIIIESFVISEFTANDIHITDADYVIVLGSGIKGTELSETLKLRLDASVNYVSHNENIPIIVSGGKGPGEDIPEAEAMSNYLISRGVSEERVILESRSTSTMENLKFSKAIIQERGITNPKIIIVTSNYHMYRAKLIGHKLGYVTYGMSSKSPTALMPINMIREYFAMIKALIS